MASALPAFAAIGFIAGMFGLGAGWANVPVLNLIMGAPIKVKLVVKDLERIRYNPIEIAKMEFEKDVLE